MGKFLDSNGVTKLRELIDEDFVGKETGKGLSTNDYDNTEKAKVASDAPQSMIAPAWNNEASYTVNNIVTDDTVLYRCTMNNVGQQPSLSSNYWETITIADILPMVDITELTPSIGIKTDFAVTRYGNICLLSIYIQDVTCDSWTTIATLPQSLRPKTNFFGIAKKGAVQETIRIYVRYDGVVQVADALTNNQIYGQVVFII